MRKATLVSVCVFIFIFALGYSFFQKHTINATESLTLDSIVVRYQRADTDALRTKGLSGTQYLADGEGMLFVYDEPIVPRFWMKDMNYAIDIIWISSDKRVVATEENISPDTFPATFSPNTPVQYVLEVPAGFVERNAIGRGALMGI